MAKLNGLSCCGIQEFEYIDQYRSDPTQLIRIIGENLFTNENDCAFILFSDVGKKKAGNNLEKYIKKFKLGKITKSPSRINPNSGNSLTAWIWAVNKINLKRHWNKIK